MFYILLDFILFGFLSYTTTAASQRRQLAQIITSCTVPNKVALTFDDGVWIYSRNVSDILTAHGAKGTFFVNGNTYDCIYSAASIDRVRYAYSQGHQFASHTWYHIDLSTVDFDRVHDEMWRIEQALTRIIGIVPKFMRPPFSKYNDNVLTVSYQRGQQVVLSDFYCGDADGATVQESKDLFASIVKAHPSNILSVSHETMNTTVFEVLPYAIQQLQGAGYELVTLAECLGQQPYQSVTSPGIPDASWTC